ncbi:MAG: tRNA-dihydrouridine synthase family protein [Candidatus Woesearchaeota archaeon]
MKPTFMLAPMEDVTDNAMRALCYRHGADFTFTEMARFDSLARKNKGTVEKTLILDDTPTWIQIVGSNEQKLKAYLKDFEPAKSFLGFNLNLGCPSPNLVNTGIGCAMVRRISKTRKLVNIVKERGFPCSVKMRLGLNAMDKKNKVYLNLIDAVDADMFIVHTRIATDTYDVPADHSVLKECVAIGKTIIANGDIDTKDKVQKVLDLGAKGVMIGRSAICNPGIFAMLKGMPVPSIDSLKAEYNLLAERFNSPQKYRKNVMKHLGKHATVDNEHVQG